MAITIQDIATKAGVSLATVSRVINNANYVKEDTRKKVEEAIKELNYVPSAFARSLSKSETSIIGLVIPEIRNPFFGEVIEGVTEVADASNLNVLLCNTDENLEKEIRALRVLQEHRIRGLIITPVSGEDTFSREYIMAFRQMNIPITLVDRNIIYSDFDGVFFDDTKAIYDATTLLLKEGHRDIAMLAGNTKYTVARNRIEGYRKAFYVQGIEYSENNIYYGDFSKESAYEVTKRILTRENLPTAIMANSNMLILGGLKAIFERGMQIPEDIAFVGYDKIEVLDIIKSNISVVEKDVVEMGRNAMHMLIERMENPNLDTRRVIMSPHLVMRGSEKMILKK
jgi:LacI family transcriptional regulator